MAEPRPTGAGVWRPRLAGSAKLQAEGAEATLVLESGSIVQLNACAACVLVLCDGTRTAEELMDEIVRAKAPNTAPAADVRQFLDVAATLGWIVDARLHPSAEHRKRRL